MKKVALVFFVAVFVPSLVLAWLALRSLRDQQFVLERQQSLLYQGVADSIAKEALGLLADHQREFARQVELLAAGRGAADVAPAFDEQLQKHWPLAEVGFVVSLDDQVLAPSLFGRAEARRFRLDNDRFLCNRESVEVYYNSPKGAINLTRLDEKSAGSKGDSSASAKGQPSAKMTASEAEFRQLIGDASEGTLSRFLQNKLNLMFWYRSPRDPKLVFGAQVSLPKLVQDLRGLIQVEPESLRSEICVALLDDAGHPVIRSSSNVTTAQSPLNEAAQWKRPFVTKEIGEALPHWEIAVYPLNPARVTQAARTLKLTFGSLIALLLFAIGIGGGLIVADLNRQLALARQKTDFVSNVSHELKTPLTSIRMFSELLAEGRVSDPQKQRSYLNVITAETARLTRLINNVLDFSRLERGEKKYNFQKWDLVQLIRDSAETYRPHLEANGFLFDCELPESPLWVKGDRDALAQIILNLLSNAEKYSGEHKEIALQVRSQSEPVPYVEARVLDRGIGVPHGTEEKIFEQFYRAHDSLSSGIQGSGLGLTLARQIARAHGGDVRYEPRETGGSCFVLRLPKAVQ